MVRTISDTLPRAVPPIGGAGGSRFTGTPSLIFGGAGDVQLSVDEGADSFSFGIGDNANAFTKRLEFFSADHANAHDWIFYDGDGTTPRLQWDESATQLLFGADFVPTGDSTISIGSATATILDLFVDEIKDRAGASVYDVENATFKTTQRFEAAPNSAILGTAGAEQIRFVSGADIVLFQVAGTANAFLDRMRFYNVDHGTLALDSQMMDGDGSTVRFSWDESATALRFNADMDPLADVTYDIGNAASTVRRVYVDVLYDRAGAAAYSVRLKRFEQRHTITGDFDPTTDLTYLLGDSTRSWLSLYVEGVYDEAGAKVLDTSAAGVAYTLNATAVPDRTLLASASATILNNNNVIAALITDLKLIGLMT